MAPRPRQSEDMGQFRAVAFSSSFISPFLVSRQVISSSSVEMSVRVSQHDCVLPSSGLRARIFYPTQGTGKSAAWMPTSQGGWKNESAEGLCEYLRLPRVSIPALTLVTRQTLPWVRDAPITKDKLPLVLFSHGLAGTVAGYVGFCSDVAASGRVVVAIEHADASAQVTYVGAERTRIPYRLLKDGEDDVRVGQYRQRIAELGDVLDDIRRLSMGKKPQQIPLDSYVDLEDLIDTDAPIIVAGHSFGAATALAFTFEATKGNTDAKVSDTVCLDPWLVPMTKEKAEVGDVGNSRVLFLDQERSGMKTSLDIRKSMRAGDMCSLKILGGGHNSSSDFSTRIPKWVAIKFGLTSADSDPVKLLQTQNETVIKFLDNGDTWKSFLKQVDENEESVGVGRSLLPDSMPYPCG